MHTYTTQAHSNMQLHTPIHNMYIIHVKTHTYIYSYILSPTHNCTRTFIHPVPHSHTKIRTHIRTHIHNTIAHTYSRTYIYPHTNTNHNVLLLRLIFIDCIDYYICFINYNNIDSTIVKYVI